MHEGTWTIRPCPHRVQTGLAASLGISDLTAGVLVRRGYADADAARAFLAGELPPHDPFLLGDMQLACERIRAAVAEGRRICVHGDYDVDGISATALAVLLLRELGADVDWHLPSRFEEGYGVSRETLGRLADEGCGLVLTVDCGITAVEEVAEAQARGLEVIVTDHHRPAETLPDCPLAARLEDLNRDRQAVEQRIFREAIAQIDAWTPEQQQRRAYAVHGDWNEGVVGIVASRLVERYHRPVVVISAKEDDDWKGSGRSIPSFDLHASLAASAANLTRWGGHKAAAGLSLKPEAFDEFVETWSCYAESVLTDEEL